MKHLSLLVAMFLLGGCMSLGGTKDESIGEFYSLDTRDFRLCKGTSTHCVSLITVVSMQHELGPIEDKFGRAVRGPNYPLDLTRMLISPPNEAYTSQRLDAEGRYRRLPVNSQTNTVWSLMKSGSEQMYH